MRKILMPLALSLLFSASANAEWITKDGKPAGESENRKSIGTFAAQLLLISDMEKFAKDWAKPETPNIKTGDKIKLGESLTGTVFFTNCKEVNEKCNLTVNYRLTSPSNKVTNVPEQMLWNIKLPKPNMIYLGSAQLKFLVDPKDEKGKYVLEAQVKDKNNGNNLNLKTSFTVE